MNIVGIIWIVGEMIVNGVYGVGKYVFTVMGEMVFTKNHIMCNAYARMNCTSPIDTVENFWTIEVV